MHFFINKMKMIFLILSFFISSLSIFSYAESYFPKIKITNNIGVFKHNKRYIAAYGIENEDEILSDIRGIFNKDPLKISSNYHTIKTFQPVSEYGKPSLTIRLINNKGYCIDCSVDCYDTHIVLNENSTGECQLNLEKEGFHLIINE